MDWSDYLRRFGDHLEWIAFASHLATAFLMYRWGYADGRDAKPSRENGGLDG